MNSQTSKAQSGKPRWSCQVESVVSSWNLSKAKPMTEFELNSCLKRSNEVKSKKKITPRQLLIKKNKEIMKRK